MRERPSEEERARAAMGYVLPAVAVIMVVAAMYALGGTLRTVVIRSATTVMAAVAASAVRGL